MADIGQTPDTDIDPLLDMPDDEFDDMIDDILDDEENEENEENEDIQDIQDIQEDETLRDAKKFLSLMEEFDIKEGSNMETNLQKNKKDIIQSKVTLVTDDDVKEYTTSIVESNELLEDFILIRETLRDDIKSTRIVLGALSEDLSSTSAEDMNGQVVLAFSQIKIANVKSMQLLIDSYEKVAQTQLSVKKLTQELKTEDDRQNQAGNGTNIQNAMFVGSPAELLASLQDDS